MATPTPEELNKQFEKLQRLAITLNKNLNSFNLTPVARDAALVGELIEKWGNELDESLSSVNDLASGFQSVVQEISQGNIGLASTKKTFNSLTSIAQQLAYEQAGINKLSEKELQTLLKKSQQAKQDAASNNTILEQRKAALIAENQSSAISLEQKKKNRAEIAKITGAIVDNQSIINEESQSYKDLNTTIRSRLELEEKIGKTMGIAGASVDGVRTALDKMGLGGLGNALGLDAVKAKMKEVADETAKGANYTGGFADKMKVLKSGVTEAGKQLKASLQDPTVVSTFLIKQFIDALKSVDSLAGDTAKQFNLSYKEASQLNNQLTNTAALSMDVAVNTKGLNESLIAVGNSLGSNAQLNEQDLVTFTKLREQAGFTNDELSGIQKLSLANGESLEDNTEAILGGAQAYASQNKLLINEKQILRDVSKASASLKLSLNGSADALARSAVQARQFGLSLEQTEKISSSLLDFESSISSELEAELLTGKDLNLEKARLLALNGDTAAAAAEIAKQVGSSVEFGKMNVIQQEAIAKAAGLGRDELAQSLIERESLANLSAKEGETAKDAFDRLVASVGYEKAKKQLGNDQLANQFKQQSAQEKIANMASKMQEIFIAIAEPVMAIVTPLIDIATKILPLVNALLLPVTFALQKIGEGFQNAFEISKAILDPTKTLKDTFKELGVLGSILGGVFTVIALPIELISEGFENISKMINSVMDPTKTLADTFKEMGPIASFIATALGAAGIAVATVLLPGLASSAVAALAALGPMIATAMAAMSAAIASTLGVGAIPIIAGIAAVAGTIAAVTSLSDGIVDSKGGLVVSGEKGTYKLDENDSIVAGTDINKPKKSTSTSSTSSPSIDLSPLMERINVLIDAVKAGGSVYLDGTKVGTAMAMSTYKTQ